MKTILVPVDFSPVTPRVVAQAAGFARALRARVTLLTVMVEPVFVPEYTPPPRSLAGVTVGNERTAQRHLTALVRRFWPRSKRVQTLLLQGSPARMILDRAGKMRSCCIVMGSHGRGAFYELLVGSTTRDVLRGTRCPVIIVPPRRRRAR